VLPGIGEPAAKSGGEVSCVQKAVAATARE
jgi:hypothetical protein